MSSSLIAVRDDGRMSSPGPRSGPPTSRRSFSPGADAQSAGRVRGGRAERSGWGVPALERVVLDANLDLSPYGRGGGCGQFCCR